MKDNNFKIEYTDTALEQLEKFKKEQVELLEKYLIKDKYVIGDELVEITASDIKEAFEKMRVIYPERKQPVLKSETLKIASMVYIFLGMIITLGAFYYDTFKTIQLESPSKALLILVGITMTIFGMLVNLILKRKEIEAKKREKKTSVINIENKYFES